MNRIVLAALIVAGCATPTVQAPPPLATPAPAPVVAPDPAPIVEGDVSEAHLGGLTVLVKHVAGAELVTEQLYVRGGALNWDAQSAGVEALAFRVASTGGTATLDKAAFARKLAGLGATVQAQTSKEWSMLQAKGLTKTAPVLLGLLADVFLRPAMPASEVEVARAQQLIGIQQMAEQPDGRLSLLLDEVRFKGHPYSARAEGTLASVKALTQAQLAAHLAGLREQSRLVLVVVGDVDLASVQGQAQALFGALPRGSAVAKVPALPSAASGNLVSETRAMPTNYIQAVFHGPEAGSAAYAAAVTATSVLRDRLFSEVRTKRNLSYAPAATWDLTGAGSYGGLYVTAVDPATTWKVMLEEFKKLQSEPLPADELASAKAQVRTQMLMRQETTDGQASSLAGGLLLTGDWRFRARLVEQVKAVTAADVQGYAKSSFGKLQVVLLGDPSKLTPEAATAL